MLKRSWFAAVFCGCAIVACPGSHTLNAQSVTSSKMLVNVTGEFREDGSCQVFADGEPVFRPADSARTTYIHDGILSLSPAAFDAHEVWCGLHGPEQLMAPLDLSERLFMVLLYAPSGKLAQAHSYEVRTETPSAENADHVVGAALFGVSRQLSSDSSPIGEGVTYLEGIRGAVGITHVEANRIVGKFTFVAQPARSM
jgi:hypothetical protein